MPQNITTSAKSLVEAAERALPIDEIVEKAAAEAVVEDFEFPTSAEGSGKARRSGPPRRSA